MKKINPVSLILLEFNGVWNLINPFSTNSSFLDLIGGLSNKLAHLTLYNDETAKISNGEWLASTKLPSLSKNRMLIGGSFKNLLIFAI